MNAVEHAIRNPRGHTALVAYVTAGFPRREGWFDLLEAVASVADVVEVGVPFSDPMADGATLQDAARVALAGGFSLPWLLEGLAARPSPTPRLLMGYANPFLKLGFGRLRDEAAAAGVHGLIIPDLPIEEAAMVEGFPVVHLVAPTTPDERVRRLAAASAGFLYAVTVAGVTGAALPSGVGAYLDRVRGLSALPVCAGFGIRTAADVTRLAPHADGVVVGTALVDVIGRGLDPTRFLENLLETP